MEINRNQYFMFGVVLLLLGVQFRMVDAYVLNEKASKIIASKMGDETQKAQAETVLTNAPPESTVKLRTVKPPQWLGWALISIGSVLVLHSLAMKKPD